MIRVDLIPQSRRDARCCRIVRRRWLVVCVGYAVILTAICTTGHLIRSDARNALADELDKVTRQITQAKADLQSLRPKLVTAQRTLAANRAVTRQPDWSVLMAFLAKTLGDDVVLRSCRLEPMGEGENEKKEKESPRRDGFVLRIAGLGRSQAAVSQFVLRLEQAELFDRVTLVHTAREPFLTGEAFAFQLDCDLGARESITP